MCISVKEHVTGQATVQLSAGFMQVIHTVLCSGWENLKSVNRYMSYFPELLCQNVTGKILSVHLTSNKKI